MKITDTRNYAWRVEVWDARAGCWVWTGPRHMPRGSRVTAQALRRMPLAVPAHLDWRAWQYRHWPLAGVCLALEPGKPLGDPVATAEWEHWS